jgi:hypothetical protein
MRQLSPRNQHSHAAANQRRQILQGIDRKVVMGHGFSNEHENGFNGARLYHPNAPKIGRVGGPGCGSAPAYGSVELV